MAPQLMVTAATVLVVGAVVIFHNEVIQLLNRFTALGPNDKSVQAAHRPKILGVMFILLFAHVAEIWLFGATFWVLLSQNGYGALSGYSSIGLMDCIYFSAGNYTTVGWGDLAATGHIRFLAGTEALVGFMMVTWSASFSYLVMARTWGNSSIRDD